MRFFLEDKYVGTKRTVLGNDSKGMVQHKQKSRNHFDILLKNYNIRRLKEEEQKECGFNLGKYLCRPCAG